MHAMNPTPYDLWEGGITRAEGCTLFAGDGRSWLDLESGVWCANLGHGDRAVNAAIAAQLETVAHVGYRVSHPVVEAAAGRLLALLGMAGGQCLFLSSGSEAVELAVTAAGHITGRSRYLCLGGHFLSSYGQSARRPGTHWDELDLEAPGWQVRLAALSPEQYAAFVLEPGNASGRVSLPPMEAVAAVCEAVHKAGGLLVADEVTTGMGRTGAWFGFEHYGLRPDLVAVGKGLGNGYPVSAVALTGYCAQRLPESGFRYAQSHQNDPLGCAAALAVMERMETLALPQQAAQTGAWLMDRLEDMGRRYPVVSSVRGRGLMCALNLSAPADVTALHRALFDAGFLTGLHVPSGTLRLYPPLTIRREELQSLLLAFSLLL